MTLPDFSFEKSISKKGYGIVAGVDEVGRGSFAGPVVAGCVAFRQNPNSDNQPPNNIRINDSKKLNSKQRELASFWIKRNAFCYGIGWASVTQINKLGIKKASEIAFRRAIKNCNRRIDYLLIDAFYIPYIKGLRRKNQKPIIKGDTKSVSIAAASIVAKVYRDKLMDNLSNRPKYKKYAWDKNKGYGTLSHRKAIIKYGTTSLHRKKFVETFLSGLALD
ncbi:ribonuclease HII [Candidatus Woesebacteria bacterium RIFOXYC1_FULL_41_14]|uniref:Ribonuclease n=4 Tax=Candidatus Woeseibacteriota TaxID=1752722 RepID=A0A0G0WZM1_9BACT|nr:MAG: Ribonuclease HII [Candidatus Woesebacteria bacterium GW2011_GWB1_40_12]KKS05256.1 MAG: Ribonuclease HII [Candidatus Woesebacteria bacterium GW2011_GWE1_41_24]KKS18200.1 MAG: Ribonuclease HII [Candidatus Woesebacteria bacterium GW2011_GWA1_41_7]OGM84558.1 MAG: ribonuclease HII [Candidatus Woesebacteria bacterium RIFOXYC1_FULL_41_14]OGM88825.1 MAG: ribonuclease HII [Candidatus Woesebacteria bacterium RIFOXYD1_FULL_41_28]